MCSFQNVNFELKYMKDCILMDSTDVPTFFKKLSMTWVGHTKHSTLGHTFWINTKAPFQTPSIHTVKTLPSPISLLCCRMRSVMNSIVFSCLIVSMEARGVCIDGHHDDMDDGMVVHSGPTVAEN